MTDDELAASYENKVYVGRSHKAPLRRPSLNNAIKNAYEQAKVDKEPGAQKRYRVVDIWAVGTNPIHEYIVVLGQD